MNELVTWLASLGLAHHAETFAAQRVDIDILTELTDRDLEKLGIAALGDRKRLLRAIAAINPPTPTVQSGRATQHEATQGHDAERRQLSVMFCDLVGSTELATTLDPEDLRRILNAYHDAVARAVEKHGGYVAQFLGDGALVYFGFPNAHEDDVTRAIQAGLEVLSEVRALASEGHQALQTRIGIATGLVVVGGIGKGTPAAELSASGETPNLAARLQGQAAPGGIVISDRTRLLLAGGFELRPLAALSLKGFQNPMQAWEVVGERLAESRFDASHAHQLPGFVGRDAEMSILLEFWMAARKRNGQTVLLLGEAGIGKSRLLLNFRQRIAVSPTQVVVLQCSPSHRNSALFPVIRALEVAANLADVRAPAEREALLIEYLHSRRVTLPHGSLDALLRLMAAPGTTLPTQGEETPQQLKVRILQTLTDIVLARSARAPLLFLIEDAHWIDPTTGEWLASMTVQLRSARVLTVVSARPEYESASAAPSAIARMRLTALDHGQTKALIDAVAGDFSLPAQAIEEIVDKTEGMPLFIEELTKTVIASENVASNSTYGRDPLRPLAIPATLQDSLMARLDRLGRAKQVAQVAAVIGRDFSHALLASVMCASSKDVDESLAVLLRAEIVFARESQSELSYSFKHALLRDIAYNSMVRSYRIALHATIAQALERTMSAVALAQPELLALHYQEAGLHNEAMHFWEAAGDLSWARSAGREAKTQYANALEMLGHLPSGTECTESELNLSLKLGQALSATEGYGSLATYESFERARQSARRLGRVEDFVSAWASSAPTLFGAGRPGEAIESMRDVPPEQIALLPAGLQVATLTNLGVAHFLIGELGNSWDYLEAARKLDDVVKVTHLHPVGGGDPAIALRAYATRCSAFSGDLNAAEYLAEQSMQIAKKRGHSPSIAWAMQLAIFVKFLKADPSGAETMSAQLVEMSERLGFKTRVATGWIQLGRAKAAAGQIDEAAGLLRRGCDYWGAVGGKFHLVEYLAQAAEAMLLVGRTDEARRFLAEAKTIQQSTDERYYAPELKRLAGRLFDVEGNTTAAERCFEMALEAARSHGSRLLALRAATDLVRIQRPGLAEDASRSLRSVLAEMKGTAEFADLCEAQALLDSA